MPSRAFQRNGLVHMSVPHDGYAYCGAAAIPYGVLLCSTDAAKEYAKVLAVAEDEVTCLECIVMMGYWGGPYEQDTW
jgi:hypothetical protein